MQAPSVWSPTMQNWVFANGRDQAAGCRVTHDSEQGYLSPWKHLAGDIYKVMVLVQVQTKEIAGYPPFIFSSRALK